jgi:prevent-host-death family protein
VRRVGVAEAKAKLSDLLDAVERGEDLVITRRGRPVAQVIPIEKPQEPLKPLDLDALRAFRETLPEQKVSSGEFIRWMRDTDRY